MAMASVTANSAVGGSGRARRLRVAAVAASTPISVRRMSAGSCAIAPCQGLAVSLEGLPAERVAHGRAEKRDAAMAEPEEMLGREPGARLVVGDHGRQVHAGQVVVHEDDRQPAMPERQEQPGVDGAEDERPVDRAMAQDAVEIGVRGPVGRRREHEAVPAGLSHLGHPAQHDPVERVVEDGGHVAALKHGDALGAPAGQAAPVDVRGVPELGRGLGDSLARAHVAPGPDR